jgi:4-hydroxybenzoate polyprenyltransferase
LPPSKENFSTVETAPPESDALQSASPLYVGLPTRESPIGWLDYFFVLRPTQFSLLWTTIMLGAVSARIYNQDIWQALHEIPSHWFDFSKSGAMALVLLSGSLNIGAAFLFNQIIDKDNDAFNNKLFFLAKGYISIRAAWIEAVLISVASIAIAYFVSAEFFFVALASLVIGGLYSLPPFEWMKRPILGILLNFVGGIVAFMGGWYTQLSFHDTTFWTVCRESLPISFGWAWLYLVVTLPDIEGDRTFGKITFPVRYGIRPTLVLTFLLLVSGIGLGLYNGDWLVTGASLLTLPMFLQVLFHPNPKEVFRPIKFSVTFLALGLSVFNPFFFLLILANFIGTRLYFKKRFGIIYPNFSKK